MSKPVTYKELHDAMEIVNQGLASNLLTTKAIPQQGFNNFVSEVQMRDEVSVEVLRDKLNIMYDNFNIIIHVVELADKSVGAYWKYISVKPLNDKAKDEFWVVDGDITKLFKVGTSKLFMNDENGQYFEIADDDKGGQDYAACMYMLEEYLHADIDIDKDFNRAMVD